MGGSSHQDSEKMIPLGRVNAHPGQVLRNTMQADRGQSSLFKQSQCTQVQAPHKFNHACSFFLLVTALLALLTSTSAQSTDAVSTQQLNLPDQKFLRSLKTDEEIEDSDDLEEERAIKFPSLKQLQKLRTSERIKEIKEALTIAKGEVKEAAQAAVAATKAKNVAAISTQLDDNAAKMLKSNNFKNKMFTQWHNDKVHPQTVFDALAQTGKYSTAKWDKIAVAYTDFATDMAKAAARAT